MMLMMMMVLILVMRMVMLMMYGSHCRQPLILMTVSSEKRHHSSGKGVGGAFARLAAAAAGALGCLGVWGGSAFTMLSETTQPKQQCYRWIESKVATMAYTCYCSNKMQYEALICGKCPCAGPEVSSPAGFLVDTTYVEVCNDKSQDLVCCPGKC